MHMYIYSIVFFYISMPLLESMLLSLLLTPVEIGPSNIYIYVYIFLELDVILSHKIITITL